MSVRDYDERGSPYLPIFVTALSILLSTFLILRGVGKLLGQFDLYVQAEDHALDYASRLGPEPRVDYVGPYEDKFYFSAWSTRSIEVDGPVPTRHYLLCDPDGCEAAPTPEP